MSTRLRSIREKYLCSVSGAKSHGRSRIVTGKSRVYSSSLAGKACYLRSWVIPWAKSYLGTSAAGKNTGVFYRRAGRVQGRD
jgi:hypothetical protein